MFKFEGDKCYRMPAHFGGTVLDLNAKARYYDLNTLAELPIIEMTPVMMMQGH